MTIVAGTGTSPALAGCGEADQRRERVQPPRIGDGLTTTLWVMACVALANIVITCVRIASAHPDRLSWLRLSLELAVGGVLFACAWRRLRSRRQNAAGSVQAPHMPAIEATEQPPALSTAVRSKWMRRARRLLTPALLAVAALTVTGQWETVQSAVGHLSDLQWRWVRWALYAEALSIVASAWLGLILLRAGGRRFSLGPILALTVASNAVSVSIPGGPAWAAAFSFDQLRRRSVNRGLAALVLCLMLVISAVALLVLLVVGVDVAGAKGPAAPFRGLVTALALLLALLVLALVAVVRVPSARASLARAISSLGADRHGRLTGFIRTAGRELSGVRCTPRTIGASLTAALLNWITDCACLVTAILAVAGNVPWRGVLVAYAIAQIAANLPITPGGIGIVEGTLSLLLVAYGMPTSTAVAAVLLYRIISFWIFVPVGWATAGALLVLQRKDRAQLPWIRARAQKPEPSAA